MSQLLRAYLASQVYTIQRSFEQYEKYPEVVAKFLDYCAQNYPHTSQAQALVIMRKMDLPKESFVGPWITHYLYDHLDQAHVCSAVLCEYEGYLVLALEIPETNANQFFLIREEPLQKTSNPLHEDTLGAYQIFYRDYSTLDRFVYTEIYLQHRTLSSMDFQTYLDEICQKEPVPTLASRFKQAMHELPGFGGFVLLGDYLNALDSAQLGVALKPMTTSGATSFFSQESPLAYCPDPVQTIDYRGNDWIVIHAVLGNICDEDVYVALLHRWKAIKVEPSFGADFRIDPFVDCNNVRHYVFRAKEEEWIL